MKAMRNGKMYVEQKDILFMQNHLPISKSIWNNFLKQAKYLYDNKEFILIFSNPDAVTFFQNQDIIIDIDDLDSLNIAQIDYVIEMYKEDLKSNHFNNEVLKYKISSLENYKLLMKQKVYIKKEEK